MSLVHREKSRVGSAAQLSRAMACSLQGRTPLWPPGSEGEAPGEDSGEETPLAGVCLSTPLPLGFEGEAAEEGSEGVPDSLFKGSLGGVKFWREGL